MDADSTRPPESRLDEILESAKAHVTPTGTPPALSRRTDRKSTAGTVGYYDQPILKPPVWTWKSTLYFLFAGASGMSALLAVAIWCRTEFLKWEFVPAFEVARSCGWIAVVGAVVCPALFVWELGRPARFLNMLRVFKWRSPMSMAAWNLVVFGSCSIVTVMGIEQAGDLSSLCVPTQCCLIAAGFSGGILATGSGVLLSVSVIPIWNRHRRSLPLHFGLSGLASTLSALMLVGHTDEPLLRFAMCVAAADLLQTLIVAIQPNDAVNIAVRRGRVGWFFKIAIQLMGPAAILAWSLGSARFGAVCFLAGTLMSHFGWLAAGRASANDPAALFESGTFSRA